MNNYLSRAELDKISEGLLSVYAKENAGHIGLCIDIEHFITSFLKLDIMYASFAEEDAGRVGFLADGETPLVVRLFLWNGEVIYGTIKEKLNAEKLEI